MVPCLDTIFSSATQQADVKDIVISMPHRGRLNFLVGPLKYPAGHIFRKIKGLSEAPEQTSNYKGTGDVLSHIGQSVDLEYGGKKVHVSLIHNPSHLEAANPVAMGKARAKLEHNADPSSALCIMIHGDAAFPAQGVVAETFLLSQLADFTVGGAVHVVVNNQVGFTTEPHKGRSSRYCSDIGKMVNTPALHVNAEDPESVVLAASIATAYRNKFKKDIILDLIGYRRYGHNELDEPSFTQPTMYSHIRSRPSVVKNYAERLISDNVIRSEDVQSGKDAINKEFEQEYAVSDKEMPGLTWLEGKWKACKEASDMTASVDTGVSTDVLLEVGESSINTHGKNIHSRLQNHYCKPRKTKLESQGKIDWATAEALAVGSLLLQDYNVRFCGQDVGRGTFSHRHFRLVDQKTDEFVIPLNHIRPTQQGRLSVVDSPLSELAVMGFEYGYSLEDPKTLPIWEAQFGDFSNTAQVTIDQFISSSEEKWWRQTGMVLLLPHGFDGAGPEHSSCRMERYLQACNTADSVEQEQEHNRVVNMSVVYPSTPANYFHLLRRQMVREYRKPLVVVGPKTMLRHPAVVSELADMAPGTHFLPVLPDTFVDPSQVEKVIFCTGKLYYDLAKERESKGLKDTALVRVEEFSPFPYHLLSQQIQSFGNARSFKWVQEEPQNMGAWSYVRPRLNSLLARESKAEAELSYVGRPPAGAPAVGISALHKQQVSHIMEKCFA
ncbi:DHTK1 dehydrogenase [Balamuthia mandrillaris]